MPGRTVSRVFASFAVDIVGDTSVPKLSLSNQTHIAPDPSLAVVVAHAASPPSDPADTTCALGYACSKLASDAAGSPLARWPPTNMKIGGLPPAPGVTLPCAYTA